MYFIIILLASVLYLQGMSKNTSLPSLFDPLTSTLYSNSILSICFLFLLKQLFSLKKKKTLTLAFSILFLFYLFDLFYLLYNYQNNYLFSNCLFSLTECLFTLSANSPPWWQRPFTLIPPTNMWLGWSKLQKTVNHRKLQWQMVRYVTYSFWRDRHGFESAFWRTFFLHFQISNDIRKAFSIKMKEITKKLKIKYRVGLG